MKSAESVPVVLRVVDGRTELLVFTHPIAGIQLVKGSVEPGETTQQAAVRELHEEAGIEGAIAQLSLGTWDPEPAAQI